MNDSAAVITAIIGIGNRLYFILYPTPDTTIIAARLGVNDEISFSPLHKSGFLLFKVVVMIPLRWRWSMLRVMKGWRKSRVKKGRRCRRRDKEGDEITPSSILHWMGKMWCLWWWWWMLTLVFFSLFLCLLYLKTSCCQLVSQSVFKVCVSNGRWSFLLSLYLARVVLGC